MAGTGKAHLREGDDVLLRVEDLVVECPVGRTGLKVNAVSGISFDVLRGENGQPFGGLTRSGGRPAIALSRVWRGSSVCGMLCSSASV